MHTEEKKESNINSRLNSLTSMAHRTEREVKDVKIKENQLERKTKDIEANAKNAEDPFGELTGMHEIHMQPLMPHMGMGSMFDEMQLPHMGNMGMPHLQISPLGGSGSGMMHHFGGLGDFLRSIRKTGPAQEHHMGPILPTGSIFTPGAHPKHLNEQKKKEQADDKKDAKNDTKKDEAKKEDSKKENNDKKDEKKDDSKPKPEGEAHSV